MRKTRPVLGVLAVATLAIAACSSGSTEPATTAAPPSQAAMSCPASPAPPGGSGRGAAGTSPEVKLLVPVDTGTSAVLKPDLTAQIHCGKVQVDTKVDVAYASPKLVNGAAKQLLMDIQVPRTPGPKPLIVYVPGGGFMQSGKEGNLPLRTYAAEAGYVVASVQYRVQPDGATYVDGIADVKAAIRYLRANASVYQVDPGKVAVWGDSAGGYLASMVGVTTGDTRYDIGDNLDQSSGVQAAVDKFGASDLSRLLSDFDPAAQQAMAPLSATAAKYVNGPDSTRPLTETPKTVAAANPVTHIGAGDPPFAIFHGDADRMISPSQTLELHNALRAAGVNSTRYVVDGAGHGDLAFMGDATAGLPWTTTTVANPLIGFLDRQLKK